MKKLEACFYQGSNVMEIAHDLIGKILLTRFEEKITSGRIVETEAYNGVSDKASHAFGGRKTRRTSVMYLPGSTSYVYLCYGLHHLFNVVTNTKDHPQAVLIRSLEPIAGMETMLQRTGKKKLDFSLTKGPGNVCKAMGINLTHTGLSVLGDEITILNDESQAAPLPIIATPRVGIDYAGEDALLPYRFYLQGNAYVSGKNKRSQ